MIWESPNLPPSPQRALGTHQAPELVKEKVYIRKRKPIPAAQSTTQARADSDPSRDYKFLALAAAS